MTTPYAHIACCIEDSPGSRVALREAERLLGFGSGRLTLVHVVAPPVVYGESLGPPPQDELEAVASPWLVEQAAQVEGAESVLLHGHPASAVCAWALESRPDLLVAGAHRGRVARLALGSFAGYLAYHAPCPVLLVRPAEP